MQYIGIDLGTSAVKLLLMEQDGRVLSSLSKTYPVSFPKSGWSEQDPSDWLRQTLAGLEELLAQETAKKDEIRGIGIGGQMHGLVILDANDRVIRPAILWNDGRTEKETAYLNHVVGENTLAKATGNIAFAGFTAPKLLWMKEHEPENLMAAAKLMLPKDYLVYCLTGSFVTDVSDASGMLLLDVKERRWSDEMLTICGVAKEQLPKVLESYDVAGTLKTEVANSLGFSQQVIVVAGAGDNAAAAIGTGTVKNGSCNLSLGTSGTVFIACDEFPEVENHAIHAFSHANGKYHLMGCMLSAASCMKWWLEEILKTDDYDAEQEGIDMLGTNQIFFLPYLMGERSPHNDPNVRGAFFGLGLDTKRADLVLAVMEGVAFGLLDSLEIARSLGIVIPKTKLSGGGAKSALWQQILANVLDLEIEIPETEEGPALGGAILAAVADGAYASVEEAAFAIVKVKSVVRPNPEAVKRYKEQYQRYRSLYPAIQGLL